VRSRGQPLAAAVIALLVVLGALYASGVGARSIAAGPAGSAPTGAWFCPHGGGPQDWTVTLQLANPGETPVPVRIRDLGDGKPGEPKDLTVDPGSTVAVPVRADGRERATSVEYFGGWVAAGWVAHAGGGEGGVAAEPCLADTSRRWFLPDGATQEDDDDYVIVMNPFATDAIFSLTLLTEDRDPIETEAWTNVTLKPFRSEAFRLNENVLGETTVSTVLDVSVGRVAAATLGVSKSGGIRSSVGVRGAASETILPGGFDQGRTDLVLMSTATNRAQLSGVLMDPDGTQPIAALSDAAPATDSARTIPITTASPSTLIARSQQPGVAFARRTFGVVSDQGSTTGASAAATAWIILPAIAGSPAHPGLVLANPGDVPAEISLSVLPGGDRAGPAPVTVEVPPGRTVQAPKGFVDAAPFSAILATSSSGTFVPTAASYSLGNEGYATYAVAVGVRIPESWRPS
jgi:hypothetical protein